MIFLDFIIFRKVYWAPLFTMTISFLSALLLIPLFTIHWLKNVIFNYWLSNMPHAGFWQPHWAMPSEILGFSDIYLTPGYQLIDRSIISTFLNISLSAFIGIFVIRYLLGSKDKNKSFYLAAILICFAIFIKTKFLTPMHNYQFYKSYTLMIPWIYFMLYTSLAFFYENSSIYSSSQKKLKLSLLNLVTVLLFFLAITTSLRYIENFYSGSDFVTKDMMNLRRLNSKINVNNYVVITGEKRISEYMLVPLFQFNWANQANGKYLGRDLTKEVIVLLNKNDLTCSSCLVAENLGSIVYENNSFVLINTKQLLTDFLVGPSSLEEKPTLNFSSLNKRLHLTNQLF